MKINSIKLSKRVALTGAIVTPTGLLIDHGVNDKDQKQEEKRKEEDERRIKELEETINALDEENKRVNGELAEARVDLEQADNTRNQLLEQINSIIPEVDGSWVKNKFEETKTENRNLKQRMERLAEQLNETTALYQQQTSSYVKLSRDFSQLMTQLTQQMRENGRLKNVVKRYDDNNPIELKEGCGISKFENGHYGMNCPGAKLVSRNGTEQETEFFLGSPKPGSALENYLKALSSILGEAAYEPKKILEQAARQ